MNEKEHECIDCGKFAMPYLRKGRCLKCYRKAFGLSMNNKPSSVIVQDSKGNFYHLTKVSMIENIKLNKEIIKENLKQVQEDNAISKEEILHRISEQIYSEADLGSLWERFENSIPKRHKFDILEGLTEKQKLFVKSQVQLGANPFGFTIYVDTGKVFYFGHYLGKINEEIEVEQ